MKVKLNQDYQLRESEVDDVKIVKKGETYEFHPHEGDEVIAAGFGELVEEKPSKDAPAK